jgi:hypothetical protein
MALKVGQQVKPVKGLVAGNIYGGMKFYREMLHEIKDGAVIKSVETNANGRVRVYITHGDGYIYPVEVFEPVIITKDEAFQSLLDGHLSDAEYEQLIKVIK